MMRLLRILPTAFILSQLLCVALAQDAQTAAALRSIASNWTGLPWPGSCPGQCLDWPYIRWSPTNQTVIAMYERGCQLRGLITSAGTSRRRSSLLLIFLQRGHKVRSLIGRFLTCFRRCVFFTTIARVVRFSQSPVTWTKSVSGTSMIVTSAASLLRSLC